MLKESGIDWLGDVPESWSVVPSWSLFRRVKRTGHADEVLLSVYRDHGVIPKDSRDDNHNVESEDLSAYQLVKPGDLVMNKMKAWQGSIALSSYKGIVSPAYFVFEPLQETDSKYFHYLLRSSQYIGAYNRMSKGVRIGQWDLDPVHFRTLPVLVPPLGEQKAIADFLDCELQEISEALLKQRELVTLLLQRRQATIDEYVGGAPEAHSLKECRLKDVANVFASNVDKKVYDDGLPVSLCNYVDVYYNDYITENLSFMEATASKTEISKFQLKSNWVILTKDSESELDIGISAYVETDLPGVVCGYHLAILEPKRNVDGLFLKWVLDSTEAKTHFARRANGLTRMALGRDAIATLPLKLPSYPDQQRIASQVKQATSEMDSLIRESKKLTNLLNERRRSLVSEAVTGKIDVRGRTNG
jgi:type I restriction enzyme S subunit